MSSKKHKIWAGLFIHNLRAKFSVTRSANHPAQLPLLDGEKEVSWIEARTRFGLGVWCTEQSKPLREKRGAMRNVYSQLFAYSPTHSATVPQSVSSVVGERRFPALQIQPQ